MDKTNYILIIACVIYALFFLLAGGGLEIIGLVYFIAVGINGVLAFILKPEIEKEENAYEDLKKFNGIKIKFINTYFA